MPTCYDGYAIELRASLDRLAEKFRKDKDGTAAWLRRCRDCGNAVAQDALGAIDNAQDSNDLYALEHYVRGYHIYYPDVIERLERMMGWGV